MQKCIAEKVFRCVPPVGDPFSVVVRIGEPVAFPQKANLAPYARCPVSMEPLLREQGIGGENQFQALCLAIEFIRTAFKAFVAEGGKIQWRDTGGSVDLASPWFCPLPRKDELRGRSIKNG
jgi:hypothetical protein